MNTVNYGIDQESACVSPEGRVTTVTSESRCLMVSLVFLLSQNFLVQYSETKRCIKKDIRKAFTKVYPKCTKKYVSEMSKELMKIFFGFSRENLETCQYVGYEPIGNTLK